MEMLFFLLKTPALLMWNGLLTFFLSLRVLFRVKRYLVDPRTWISVLFLFAILNFFLAVFQVFLNFVVLLVTGKTIMGLLPQSLGYITRYGIYSIFSTFLLLLLFLGPLARLFKRSRNIPIFRPEVIDVIVEMGRESIYGRFKRGLEIVIVGIVLSLLLG